MGDTVSRLFSFYMGVLFIFRHPMLKNLENNLN